MMENKIMEDRIKLLCEIINKSNNIVFFGGAGCSVESGIPDFRSSDGLYSKKLGKNFTPEEAVSHTFFVRHTEEFYDFYKKNLIYRNALPNDCHKALAKLEQMGKVSAIVTQNIDGLHQAAGSKNVFELHGSVLRNYCISCGEFYDVDYVLNAESIPVCKKCGYVVKPDVVLYEEGLNDNIINGAINAIRNADTLIIGGTSLAVYPAAGFINYFRGKNLVLINKTESNVEYKAQLVIHDSIGKVFAQVMKQL